MPTLNEKIEAEIECINKVLKEFPSFKVLPTLSILGLAKEGTGFVINN
jgi:hypothetical protein